MPTCCNAPDPIFLGDGRRWCRHCKRDIDPLPAPRCEACGHYVAVHNLSGHQCGQCSACPGLKEPALA